MAAGGGRYRLGPFLIASEIPLPELVEELDGEPTVSIRVGAVPERLEGVVANESRWWASRDAYLQRVPGVGGFLVRGGREVTVEPAEGARDGDIRAYLLGPVFLALCHQAEVYSLHASSVRVGDGVVAFLGQSGAGKSTLAACLERRGHEVVSDDICMLDARGAGDGASMMVVPVVPALKLWRSALEHLGARVEELPRVFSLDEKFRVEVRRTDERLPLRAVVFLEWAEPGEGIAVVPAGGVQAMARLMEFLHFAYLMKATGRQEEGFLLCGRILGQARACTFRRPREFAALEGGVNALEGWFG
jgi:hypothetical protein